MYAYALCVFKYISTYVSISGSQRLKSDVSLYNSPYIFIFWKGLFWAQNLLILLDLLDSFPWDPPSVISNPNYYGGMSCPLAFLRAPGIQSPVLMLVPHKFYKKSHIAGTHIVLETQFLTRACGSLIKLFWMVREPLTPGLGLPVYATVPRCSWGWVGSELCSKHCRNSAISIAPIFPIFKTKWYSQFSIPSHFKLLIYKMYLAIEII